MNIGQKFTWFLIGVIATISPVVVFQLLVALHQCAAGVLK